MDESNALSLSKGRSNVKICVRVCNIMSTDKQIILKSLPSVDNVLKTTEADELVKKHGRSSAVAAIRKTINAMRQNMLDDKPVNISESAVVSEACRALESELKPRLTRVVNATGIILHTGLGRAFMPDCARKALNENTGYCNIQMDLVTGERIKRETCIMELVKDLTGAEDAVLVNNNAGATLLVLQALAEKKEVIISRGELIEIGGSFRLPEIMELSGATLREVGSTNKTHLKDYSKAINTNTALLMKAHKSNYCIVGFTKEVGIDEIAALGKEKNVPVIDDLGCGALVGLEDFGLEHEMTVRESLEAGSDLVLFSTDKLIGGPQGGLIVGKKALTDKIRAHPLYRALRVDKMTLAALEATLRLFKSPELLSAKHPVYRMLSKSLLEMEQQARELAGAISKTRPDWKVSIQEEKSYLGGGSLPGSSMKAFAVKITSDTASDSAISQALRSALIPVIPYLADGAVFLNMRTVFPNDFDDILQACKGS